MNHDARQLAGQLRVKLGEVMFPVSTSSADELRTHVRSTRPPSERTGSPKRP
jgi:hypothetical protein